jgi:hypothetical protein
MNNYHTFLIRPGLVTQLAAHLAAGIVALALVTGLFMPKVEQLSPRVESVPVVVAVSSVQPMVVAGN